MYELNGKYFDWDKKKNLSNLEKHGVPFKAAATEFFDSNAIRVDDWEHSYDEEMYEEGNDESY